MSENGGHKKSLQLQGAEEAATSLASPIFSAAADKKKSDNLPAPPSQSILLKIYADLSKAHNYIYAAYQTLIDSDDKILSKKGAGSRDYYDSMIDSDAVLAGLIETRISAVSGLDWEIQPASEEEYDLMLADFVTFALNKVGDIETFLKDLLRACVTGYSVIEIVWDLEVYEGVSKLVPRLMISRRPERFRFDLDYNLRLLTTGNYDEGVIVPPYKFVVHSFQTRYANPHGVSLLRAVWWNWWFKHHAFKWWLQAAERGAVLTPVGYYPETFTPAERKEFAEALEKFVGNKYVSAMKGSEVTFPQIKIDPNFCKGLVDSCDEQMRSRILGSTLSSGTASTGSRALGQVHDKRLQERIESDAKQLMATINKQLIQWIIFLNFPEPDRFPTFKMKYEPPRDMKQIGETLKLAASIGIPISVRDAAELLNLPLAEEDEELITAPVQTSPMNQGPEDEDEEESDKDDDDSEEEVDDEDKDAARQTVRPIRGKIKKASMGSVRSRGKKYQQSAERIVNATIINGAKYYKRLGIQIEKWLAKFGNLDVAYLNVDSFRLDDDDFTTYLGDVRFFAAVMAYHDVFDNPKAQKYLASKGRKRRFKVYPWQTIRDRVFVQFGAKGLYEEWTPIPSEDTIERFQQRKILTREEFDMLEAHERRRAFTAANMSTDTIEKKLKPAMMRALQEGRTLQEFSKEIDTIVLSKNHAENIYRTNLQTAYNNGHAEAIYSPELAPVIPAFQFDAIIDNRTTLICEERNGQVYSRQDIEVLDVVPPCHWQCRSTIIEVFADEWDGKISPAPVNNPAVPGFGRWVSQLAIGKPVPAPLPISIKPIKKPKKEIVAGKPTIAAKKPAITAGPAPSPSGTYKKPWKGAPDKLDGTSVRAQRAFPQYSKPVKKSINEAYNIAQSETIESGAAIRFDGKMASKVVRGEEVQVIIPRDKLPVGKANAIFHTHPANNAPFSNVDIEHLLSSRNYRTSVIPTKDYVYVMSRKSATPVFNDYEASEWGGFADAALEEHLANVKNALLKTKGYVTDADFVEAHNQWLADMGNDIYDYALNEPIKDVIEYSRIPRTEFEGLLGYEAESFNRGRDLRLADAEKEVIVLDDTKLSILWDRFVDYVEVYE